MLLQFSPNAMYVENAGEDLSEELKAQDSAQWQWRVGCLGRPMPGASLEDSADELKGIANYEGIETCSISFAASITCVLAAVFYLSLHAHLMVLNDT